MESGASVESLCLSLVFLAADSYAETTVYTVGVCGVYDDIQDAIDALVVGADTDIRIQGNSTYEENLLFSKFFNAGTIEVTGGWDCPFPTRVEDPSLRLVDGAGLSIMASGDARFLVEDSLFSNNRIENAGGDDALGGGVHLETNHFAQGLLSDSRILDNTAIGDVRVASGLYVESAQSGEALVERTGIMLNIATGAVGGGGGAAQSQGQGDLHNYDQRLGGCPG